MPMTSQPNVPNNIGSKRSAVNGSKKSVEVDASSTILSVSEPSHCIMSYLVECVAGPSRILASRTGPRLPIRPLRHGAARPTLTQKLRRTTYAPRRLQSTVAPIVIDSVATVPETSILDPLANALLSSPLPAWATIIALTLCVRTGITLPVSLWQRRRMLREASEVRPRMKEINEKLAVSVMKDCRARGVDYEGYKKELKSKVCRTCAELG